MPGQATLEDIMDLALSGDTLADALGFAAFLRAEGLHIEYNPDEQAQGKWTGAIGGVVGDSIGYMYVDSGADFPAPWCIWLNEYEFDDSGSEEDDALKHFLWANVNKCTRCNPDWEHCGGGDRTVLGKTFERLCHSPMFFYMPDTEKLRMLKKLMPKVYTKRTAGAGPALP